MPLALHAIVQNLVFLMFFLSLDTLSSGGKVPKTLETRLVCGPSDVSVNDNFVPNLINVMENVGSQVLSQGWGFDSIDNPLPEVHALAQCYENLSPHLCEYCYTQSRIRLSTCLPSHSARIYFDGCFLRYETYEFFQEHLDPDSDFVNCSSTSDVLSEGFVGTEFKSKVAQVIDDVIRKATKAGGSAVSEVKGGVVSVYALAQCWETLEDQKCNACLDEAGSQLNRCAPGAEGRAMFTGCYMRYSTDRFFGEDKESKNCQSKKNCPLSENLERKLNSGLNEKTTITIAICATIAFAFLICFGAFIGYKRLSKRNAQIGLSNTHYTKSNLHFKYEVLEKATESFSSSRKLGQGGAGSVFKGDLPDGRTVAVKKLVFNNSQWVDQFFNEVNLISGVHHKHLVRLLGCSIEGPESLLVYEYVPNRSLDKMLFVKSTVQILNWQQRVTIIIGIAEGLAYLHGGSGVKIIHRDIKTSNVLLDENLTPKIADFGLAICASPDRTHVSTGIAGTLGYMAPEYLVRGKLSEKADVYAFGVLVLEVATGRKNSVFSQGSSSILHCVWKHYKSKTLTESIDAGLKGKFQSDVASRVLQIGLLCTQASVALRPSMSNVVRMLKDKHCQIPAPKQPPFLNASVLSPNDPMQTSFMSTPLSLTDQLDVEMSTSSTCRINVEPDSANK